MEQQSLPGPAASPAYRWPMPDLRARASAAVQHHRALQQPCELAVALATAAMISPATYLEIGTYAGGTAWAFAQLPSVETVISVDHTPEPDAIGRLADIPCETYQLATDSHHYETLARIGAILDGTPADVLLIDGSHDYQSALADWELYRPLVRSGGLVILHDTQPHKDRPDVEVHRLWGQIEESYQTTEIVAEPGIWAGTGIVWV